MKTSTAFAILYLVSGLTFLAYICGKAWRIPITHDEAVTTLLIHRHTYAELVTYNYKGISANNHVLNTIFAKAWTELNGLSPLALRMGNLLAGFLYILIGYLILSRFFQNNVIRVAGLCLWFANPYLAEFLALARGYGMSTSLEAGAIGLGALYLASSGNLQRQRLYLATACLLAILAVWANFVTLNFFLAFMGLLALGLWRKPGRQWVEAGMIATAAVLLGLLIVQPMGRIKAAGDFRFFGISSFFKDTVQTFIDCLTMGRGYFGGNMNWLLAGLLILIFFASLLIAGWGSWKSWSRLDVSTWLLALFPATVLINILINKVTGASFLNTRTTLFFYPLLVCALLQFLQLAYTRWRLATGLLLIPLLFALGINLIKNASWSDTYEWRYDRNTYTVLNYVEQMYQCEGRTTPYDLRVQCLFHPSFQFHTWLSRSPYANYVSEVQEIPCTVPTPIDSTVDFYYVQREYLDHFPANYRVVLETSDQLSVVLRKE